MEGTFDFQASKMVENFRRISTSIFKNFIPGFTVALKTFNRFLENMDLKKATISVANFGEAIVDYLIRPIEKVFGFFSNIEGVFTSVLASVTNMAINAASNIAIGIANTFNKLNPFGDLFDTTKVKEQQKVLNATFGEIAKVATADMGTPVSDAFTKAFDTAKTVAGTAAQEFGASLKDQVKKGMSSGDNNDSKFFDKEKALSEALDARSALSGLGEFIAGEQANVFQGTTKQYTSFLKHTEKFAQSVKSSLKDGLGNGAGQAFSAFGAALVNGENALEAFGKAFAKAIGQQAVQLGTRFILEGIAVSFNPFMGGPAVGGPLIAAGAALATFGGALGALVGGGGAGGAAGGASGGDVQSSDPELASAPEIQQEQATAINVTVEGNVVDQDQFFVDMADGLRDAIQKDGAILEVRTA
jgi:hypothetical protein